MRRVNRGAAGGGALSRRPARSTNLRKLTRRGSVACWRPRRSRRACYVADRPNHDAQHLATRYVTAWTHGRVAAMYGMLDPASKARVSERRFAAELTDDRDTATVKTDAGAEDQRPP